MSRTRAHEQGRLKHAGIALAILLLGVLGFSPLATHKPAGDRNTPSGRSHGDTRSSTPYESEDSVPQERHGVATVRLVGTIGVEITGQLLERLIARADRAGAAEIVLAIESNEGGYLSAAEHLARVLDRPDRPRVLAYVDSECAGVAAIFAMSCDELWVGTSASLTSADPLIPYGRTLAAGMDSRDAQTVRTLAERSEKRGKPRVLAGAFVNRVRALWAEPRPGRWRLLTIPSLGQQLVKLKPQGLPLVISADHAVRIGLAEGHALEPGAIEVLSAPVFAPVKQRPFIHLVRSHASSARREIDRATTIIAEASAFTKRIGPNAASLTGGHRSRARSETREYLSEIRRIERLRNRHEHFRHVFDPAALSEQIDAITRLLDRLS